MVAFKIGLLFSYVTFAFGKNVKNSEEFLYSRRRVIAHETRISRGKVQVTVSGRDL